MDKLGEGPNKRVSVIKNYFLSFLKKLLQPPLKYDPLADLSSLFSGYLKHFCNSSNLISYSAHYGSPTFLNSSSLSETRKNPTELGLANTVRVDRQTIPQCQFSRISASLAGGTFFFTICSVPAVQVWKFLHVRNLGCFLFRSRCRLTIWHFRPFCRPWSQFSRIWATHFPRYLKFLSS